MPSLDQLERPVPTDPPLLRPPAPTQPDDEPRPRPPWRRLEARPRRSPPSDEAGARLPWRGLEVRPRWSSSGEPGARPPRRGLEVRSRRSAPSDGSQLTRLERLRRTERVVTASIFVLFSLGLVGTRVVREEPVAEAPPTTVLVEVPRAATSADLQAATDGLAMSTWSALAEGPNGLGPLDLDGAARRYIHPDTARPILSERGYRAGYAREWKQRRAGATLTLVAYAMGTSAQARDLQTVLGQATAADLDTLAQPVPGLPGGSVFSRTRGDEAETIVLFAVHNVYVTVSEAMSPPGPSDAAVAIALEVAGRLA